MPEAVVPKKKFKKKKVRKRPWSKEELRNQLSRIVSIWEARRNQGASAVFKKLS